MLDRWVTLLLGSGGQIILAGGSPRGNTSSTTTEVQVLMDLEYKSPGDIVSDLIDLVNQPGLEEQEGMETLPLQDYMEWEDTGQILVDMLWYEDGTKRLEIPSLDTDSATDSAAERVISELARRGIYELID